MRRAAVLVLAASTVGAPVHAQDLSVRSYVTPAAGVGVGQQFVLNVEVSGTQSIAREPQLPDVTDFAQFLGSGSQSSMQISGGRTTVSVTIQYRFQALKEGTFRVPALTLEAAGETLTTNAVELTVSATPPTGAADRPRGTGETEIAPEDVFITAEASSASVRTGEPLVVEYRIWTRLDVSSYAFTRIPEPEGFWVEDITPEGQPRVEQLARGGQQYASAVIRRVALVPTVAGTREIAPVAVEAQVRVRRSDPFESIFGRSSLFGTAQAPTTVVSNPLTVTVEPLPPGRPEPFSGVVGALNVTAELDRDSVAANGAVTLTVRVSGTGHLRAVPEALPELPADFEAFPPEVSETVSPTRVGLRGEKVFEYVLIPRAPGRREIPSIALGYFDVRAGEYRTAVAAPLELTVTGVDPGGAAAPTRAGVAELRRDIRFIHLGAASLKPVSGPLHEGAAFWILVLLPLAGIAGAVGLRSHWDRLEGDVAYARGRRAGRVARKRLAAARALAGGADPRPFYAEVDRALRGLVTDRLNLPEAGLRTEELAARLAGAGVAAETASELADCLRSCDRQRFAPPGSDPGEAARFLKRAENLMTALDKAVKR